ncbi:hypothetical protein [Paraburkholderia sediminicola]|uniref:hypothetical protein n=1 Tax=Paraburkholderia sediminicola TaxID=458836 RepID=UPI0038BA0F45
MSGRVGLYWAWLMLDRFRARQNINAHQIEIALAAIEAAHGRRPIHGSPTYEFDDEQRLREKVVAR